MNIKIDKKLQAKIPPITEDSFKQLEVNILEEGCRDSLIVWSGENLLLDGHNRYKICNKHDIDFDTNEIDLENREEAINWIINNQLGRRNLTPEEISYLRGQRYKEEKKAATGRSDRDFGGDKMSPPKRTRDRLAEEFKTTAKTIERDAKFAESVDAVVELVGDDEDAQIKAKQNILSRDKKITKKDTTQIAEIAKENKEKAKTVLKKVQTGEVKNVDEALRAERRKESKEKFEKMIAKPLPKGKYRTIIIDPPWPIEKIIRDVRPNQDVFDYPIQTLQEIESGKFNKPGEIPKMSTDDCHLFLWTTQKFLLHSFRIIERWGFNYIFTMVWHKDGGFQPYGLPQYNCEFVVYGRKGSTKFLDTKKFDCCFNGKRREHSRKPDEFYETIVRVCPGPIADVFSREEREGIDSYGNESEKF